MKIKLFGALVLSAATLAGLAACNPSKSEDKKDDQKTDPVAEKVSLTYHYNYPFVSEDEEGYVEEPDAKVVEVEKGKAITVEKPTLAGYVFSGWYESETTVFGEGVELKDGITEDTEVYARWVQGEVYEKWSVVGDFEGHKWTPEYDGWVFETEDGIHYTYEGLTLNEGQEWKAIANFQWNAGELAGGNLSASSKEYAIDAGNIKTKKAGVYTVKLDLYKGELELVRTAEGGKWTKSFEVYLLGGFNSWNTESGVAKFTPVDGATLKGTWKLENFAVTSATEFKIVPHSTMTDGTTDTVVQNWTGPKAKSTAGVLIADKIASNGADDPNFTIAEGVYNFTVTINNPWLDDMVCTAEFVSEIA